MPLTPIRAAILGAPLEILKALPNSTLDIVASYTSADLHGWEAVLANRLVDVVIFNASQQTEGNQAVLRTLIQNQIPVAIVQPDADSLFAYELEMIRVDAGGRLCALTPPAGSTPFATTILHGNANLPDDTMLGVYEHLTHDLLFLQPELGMPKYVFAMGGRVNDDIRNLTINVEFEAGCILNWAKAKTDQKGTSFHQDDIQVDYNHQLNDAQDLMHSLTSLVADDVIDRSWVQFASIREAAELISISLRKGRRIEIFDGNPTEADSFKGVMSTAGCFILLFVLSMITLFAAFDISQISETRDQHLTALETNASAEGQVAPLWIRLWPVYPLVLFIGFQFLRYIIRTDSENREAGDTA